MGTVKPIKPSPNLNSAGLGDLRIYLLPSTAIEHSVQWNTEATSPAGEREMLMVEVAGKEILSTVTSFDPSVIILSSVVNWIGNIVPAAHIISIRCPPSARPT